MIDVRQFRRRYPRSAAYLDQVSKGKWHRDSSMTEYWAATILGDALSTKMLKKFGVNFKTMTGEELMMRIEVGMAGK